MGGGKKKKTVTNLNSDTLDKILKKIKKKDKEIPKSKTHSNRAGDVYSFFEDIIIIDCIEIRQT